MKSNCCGAPVSIEKDDVDRAWVACMKCGKPTVVRDVPWDAPPEASVGCPSHYRMGNLEAKDIVRRIFGMLDPRVTRWQSHCLATALYYWFRAGRKGDAEADFAKAERWWTFMDDGMEAVDIVGDPDPKGEYAPPEH